VAEATLVGPNVEAGAKLIDDIRRSGIKVVAAAWVLDTDRDRWRLHIAAHWPFGLDGNPYRALTEFFGLGLRPLSRPIRLDDVAAHRPDSQYARALIRLADRDDRTVRRVSDRYVEGVFFPDAIVYGIGA
jgi:hypothetical protein